jgi:hypothetical protein
VSQSAQLWARLNVDENRGLRRGAWYRVIGLTADNAGLEINRQETIVPRGLLDLVDEAPRRWTVVARPADARGPATAWGDQYAVCPRCRTRARLTGQPESLLCPNCRSRFHVAWDEWLISNG